METEVDDLLIGLNFNFMQSKSLLIAIAAFAVTASGVHAYGGSKTLYRAGLSKDQVQAVVEASSLRAEGNLSAARDRLVEAGIDEQALRSIHKEVKQERRKVLANPKQQSYADFKSATKNSPVGDIITNEEDFRIFAEAQELRRAGQWEKANEILIDLGLILDNEEDVDFSEEQWSAHQAAHRANQKSIARAIMSEAGIE